MVRLSSFRYIFILGYAGTVGKFWGLMKLILLRDLGAETGNTIRPQIITIKTIF